ncbi:ABC transporter ATP-binding protein [Clostridium tetani]|uniref:ABC transporter ATP-binding protein n=1 Tax=Clostridium tetani TaxID=1513 RepID=UPI00100BAA46|nr:ABC transporter ATP-binding protein [Clostridium tetani]RXI50962.1 ABC transporter ATP-binding protein [Clostridium tetani]RXI56974.1 ABC transporter ATP-binding protein [Clostridium tetani]RXM69729.1 ABC transporter ATP-binding protein [Clostridium tetani]BDR63497.1 ABC transporter ATP-binding protein [Clostridium tetani]BDR69016.1 ABC transporter ATP-binding protein [Clostridium tetani]
MEILKLRNIIKTYGEKNNIVHALNNINLDINSGDMVSIMGPSGCGKSSLLNILGCIDSPTDGEYILYNKKILFKNFNELAKIRNEKVSFIFQNFALIKELSVIDNVTIPLNFRKIPINKRKQLALKYIKKLNMENFINSKVINLSGGQQQRVAIARALAQETDILIADEPTGSLDSNNTKKIMEIFKSLNSEGKTIIIATHDYLVSSFCNKNLTMRDGKFIC